MFYFLLVCKVNLPFCFFFWFCQNCLLENLNYPGQQVEKNVRIQNERKMKILNMELKLKEGNVMETEDDNVKVNEDTKTEGDIDEMVSQMSEEDLQMDDLEAEKHWEKHVFNNKSVIFDSFQGQFKNTVCYYFYL